MHASALSQKRFTMLRRYTVVLFALFILSLVVTLAACNGKTPTTPTGPVLNDTPVISSFVVSPTVGPAGTLVTLNWAVTGASTRVAITASSGVNPGTGFATTGTATVVPQVSTVYTLAATNPNSGVQVNATVSFTVK